jgi:hypothetical protein
MFFGHGQREARPTTPSLDMCATGIRLPGENRIGARASWRGQILRFSGGFAGCWGHHDGRGRRLFFLRPRPKTLLRLLHSPTGHERRRRRSKELSLPPGPYLRKAIRADLPGAAREESQTALAANELRSVIHGTTGVELTRPVACRPPSPPRQRQRPRAGCAERGCREADHRAGPRAGVPLNPELCSDQSRNRRRATCRTPVRIEASPLAAPRP